MEGRFTICIIIRAPHGLRVFVILSLFRVTYKSTPEERHQEILMGSSYRMSNLESLQLYVVAGYVQEDA